MKGQHLSGNVLAAAILIDGALQPGVSISKLPALTIPRSGRHDDLAVLGMPVTVIKQLGVI